MGFKKANKENTPKKKVVDENGKRNTKEVQMEVLSENSKYYINSDISINNDNNRNNVVENNVVEKTKLKFKRSNVGIKKNNLPMFGQTSDEKLQLFKDNLIKQYPHILDYFLNKEVEKFRNKLGE